MSFGFDDKNTSQSSSGSYTGNYSGTSSATSNSNQNSNYNTNTQNTNPAWVTSAAPQLYGQAQALAGVNPQTYVAGPSSLQTTAANGASGLTTPNYEPVIESTANMINLPAAQANATQASGYVNQYMNPYLNDVLNTSLAAYDNTAGQTQAQQQLQMAGNGAFGGSGAAIDQALTNAQLQLGRGTLASGIQSQGYNTALGAAQNDANNATSVSVQNAQLRDAAANRSLQGDQTLASILGQQNSNNNQNIATQAGVGQQMQTIAQQQAQAPLDLQSWLAQNYAGMPLNLFTGQTSNGTQNQTGTEQQTGTQSGTQSGTQQSTGNSNTMGVNFGFSVPGFGGK